MADGKTQDAARARVVAFVRDSCGDEAIQTLDRIIRNQGISPSHGLAMDSLRSSSSDLFERYPGLARITLMG